MFDLYQYALYTFLIVWFGVAIYKTLKHFQAMKADRSRHFNLFQLIGNLFSELFRSFVSLFVLSVLAAGAIYLIWLLVEELLSL
jgi:hypothetical protein